MKDILFYQLFDVACTVAESIYMILLMSVLSNKKIRSKQNMVLGICLLIVTVVGTYLIPIVALKSVLFSLVWGIVWSILYKAPVLMGTALSGLSLGLLASLQAMVNLVISFFWNNPSFDMGGVIVSQWQWGGMMEIICLCAGIGIYLKYRNFQFRWEKIDLLLIGITGYAEILIAGTSIEKLLMAGVGEKSGLLFSSSLVWVIVFLIIHFQNTSFLRDKEEKERLRLQSLEEENSYFQAKAEEEKKVRKLYHDMKNLMLAAKLNGERKDLLDTVEAELEEYGQYYESGNAILNVLLKEKMKKAREKEIDIQLDVDFAEGGFMQDRDIITIFGNALDNAIEACEMLPAQERLITVKAARVRNLLTIYLENSMDRECVPDLHTTKEDDFLHGFGIQNIQEAVGRYSGTCVIQAEKRLFVLKILIPVS